MSALLYPIFVNLAHEPVLVVGGGGVGLRKIRGLLECGARVTVVSPVFGPAFADVAGVEKIVAAFEAGMVAPGQWRLIFAATNDAAVNRAVREAAKAAGILCCRCDDQAESDFSGAAVARVGGVTAALSTQGASPGAAARIRDQVAAAIDPVLAELAALAATWRGQAKDGIADPRARHDLLQKLAGEEMERRLRERGRPAAEELFRDWLAEARAASLERAVHHAP